MSEQTIPVEVLAQLMDDCTDSCGQWDGGDVCDALANLIERAGGWKSCEVHSCYSASHATCPFCEAEDDDDDDDDGGEVDA